MGKLRHMTAVYLMRGERMLLLYREGGRVVNEVWTGSAGGHFEPDELCDARACVLRELEEELGLTARDIAGLALRYITLRATPDEIRENYYFFATLRDHVPDAPVSNEGTCRWFDFADVAGLSMPYTAGPVVEHYLREGRHTSLLYGGIAGEEGVSFTAMPRF